MNHKMENSNVIKLGRGSPFSKAALRTLWQAAISKNPANDWAKGRMLTMVISLVVLSWALMGMLDLVNPGADSGMIKQDLAMAGSEVGTTDDIKSLGQPDSGERLRNDMFQIPNPPRKNINKSPKTNPVELLALIELQGVLGGKKPRAIVLYKGTKKTSTVSVGDDLGEFKVVEIRDRSVILKWREELFELLL